MTHRKRLNAASRYWVWWATLSVSVMIIVLFLSVRPSIPDSTADAVVSVRMRTAPGGSGLAGAASDSVLPGGRSEELLPIPSSGFFPLKIYGVWLGWIMWAWLAASTLMLARLILSYLLLEAKRSRGLPLSSTAAIRIDGILKAAGLRGPVQLIESTETPVPMAIGLHRPCIIFPAHLVGKLRQEELDQIALHEAGHLVRRDDYGLILQRAIQALFVFHPLVHWICRQIDIEREIACDDFVLNSAQEGLPYASCLTRVAELCGGVDGALGVPAVSSRPALVQRIELLLDEKSNRSIGLMKTRLALVVTGLIAAGWSGVLLPRAVVFAAEAVVPVSEARIAADRFIDHAASHTDIAAASCEPSKRGASDAAGAHPDSSPGAGLTRPLCLRPSKGTFPHCGGRPRASHCAILGLRPRFHLRGAKHPWWCGQ
jgi:beta-lactamase regulating signal transducer with metallopeptidase domain